MIAPALRSSSTPPWWTPASILFDHPLGAVVSAERVVGHARSRFGPRSVFIYDLDVPVIIVGRVRHSPRQPLHLVRTGAAGVCWSEFSGRRRSATRAAIGVEAPMTTAIAGCGRGSAAIAPDRIRRTVLVQMIVRRHQASGVSFEGVRLQAPAPSCRARWPAATPKAPRKGMLLGSVQATSRPDVLAAHHLIVARISTLEEILYGPSHQADGTTNFIGALRRAMASTGYVDLKQASAAWR
ncbi:MAG: hypothetical protein ACLUUF_02190 [Bifidobacterium pullorum]